MGLLDLTLKEILQKYCVVQSPECNFSYGIAKWEDIKKLEEEYDFSNQASIEGNCLISDEIDLDNRLDLTALKKLCDNIGVDKLE